MKRFSEQFNKRAEAVKLQVSEKRILEERLRAYMEYHPLPTTQRVNNTAVSPAIENRAEPFFLLRIPFRTIFKLVAPVTILVLLIVPFAANNAVPGDTLYAIKQVNENIRGSLIFDSYQKVEWETERLNRRIAEVRLLTNEGRLTDEVELGMTDAIRVHTENVQKQIDVLREVDADEATIASISLYSTLEAQSASLRAGEVSRGDVIDEIKPGNILADALDASSESYRQTLSSTTLPSYDKLMARVEQNTTRIHELRSSLNKLNVPGMTEIDRRIDDLERSITSTMNKSTTAVDEAQAELVDVLRRTQRLIVYMTELKVEVTVDINNLVPVIMTEEEEVSELSRNSVELKRLVEIVKYSLDKSENASVRERVAVSLSEIASIEEKLASSTIEFEFAYRLLQDALALANDSLLLLEQTSDLIIPPIIVETETATSGDTVISIPDVPVATSGEMVVEEKDDEGVRENE